MLVVGVVTIWPGDHQHDPLNHPGEDDPHPDTPNTLRDHLEHAMSTQFMPIEGDGYESGEFYPEADHAIAAIQRFASLGGVERLEAAQLLFGAADIREGVWDDTEEDVDFIEVPSNGRMTRENPCRRFLVIESDPVVLSDPARDAPKEDT